MASSKTMAVILIVIIAAAGAGAYIILFDPFGPTTNPNDVAIVFATGGLGDKSFNDGCYEGAQRAESDFDISFTFSEPSEITQYEGFIRGYAAHAGFIEPYDLIISVGFDQADALMEVAEEYPDQAFAIVDMFIDPGNYSNVASLLFSEHEGSALVGAVAGMMTQTDKIGFLGGMDIPLINKFYAGYVFGANYTNEGIDYDVQYAGDWADPTLGQTLTDSLYTDGADIVFAAAGRTGLGAFDSAKAFTGNSTPIWVIGVDSPQMYLGCADPDNPAPPTVGLTSMLKKVDVAVYDIIEEATQDTFTGGLKFFDLSNGGHDIEIDEDLLTLPQDVLDMVDEMKEGIINGSIVVPDAVYWT